MRPPSLTAQVGLALVLAAGLAGALVWVWTDAARAWAAHLDRAERAGTALYGSLVLPGLPAPRGLTLTALPPAAAPPFAGLPPATRETRLTLLDARGGLAGGGRLALIVAAPRSYALADLAAATAAASPAERLGQVTRTLARNCADAVLFARRDAGPWLRIEGAAVWSCAARPADLRLPVTLAVVVAGLAVLGWLAGQRAALGRVLADRKSVV